MANTQAPKAGDEHPMATPPLFKRDEADPTESIFFGCGYCAQVFHEKIQLETHIRLLHPGAPYCCTPAPLNPDQAELLHVPHTTLHAEGIPLSELARHNTPEDCWVAMNGKVYDLTEFLDRHPGGRNTITSWAGKDCSTFFNGIHQESWIKQYLRPESCLGELGIKDNAMSDKYWEQLRQVRVSELKEELHYFCDVEAAEETAAPYKALQGVQGVSGDKVQARLKDLNERLTAAVKAENFADAEDIKKAIDKLQRQANLPTEAATGGGIPLSEVAKHNKISDCWVALHGKVLDLTQFIADNHEGRNPILAMAGRDATPTFNKIRGRFPSEEWNEEYMRPEMLVGDVAKEVKLNHHDATIKQLKQELRMLEGPSEAEKAAMNAAAQAAKDAKAAAVGGEAKGEDEKFPKLKDIRAKHGAVPLFTRAEVAEHNTKEKPYIILHNKVYDMTSLLGSHPGGDEVLLSRAGTDCTVDFEVFEHSEKSRVRRDQDMLVGELHPDERQEMAQGGAGEAGGAAVVQLTENQMWLKWKAYDAAFLTVGWYLYKTMKHTKPLPSMMYSRALRHLHAIMAAGIFTTVATAQAAARVDGATKKSLMRVHKQSGILMLFAILVRMVVRLKSGIPPRFPGFPVVQFVESQSLRVFYALALALPVSGVAFEWFTYWAPAFQKEENPEADARNEKLAKQSIEAHRVLGKFLEYAWLPFHLGYTTLWHASQGRGVVRKVTPFL